MVGQQKMRNRSQLPHTNIGRSTGLTAASILSQLYLLWGLRPILNSIPPKY